MLVCRAQILCYTPGCLQCTLPDLLPFLHVFCGQVLVRREVLPRCPPYQGEEEVPPHQPSSHLPFFTHLFFLSITASWFSSSTQMSQKYFIHLRYYKVMASHLCRIDCVSVCLCVCVCTSVLQPLTKEPCLKVGHT